MLDYILDGFKVEMEKVALSNLTSALIGGAIGGGTGILSDKEHRLRNALIGISAGTGAGLGIKKIHSVFKQHSFNKDFDTRMKTLKKAKENLEKMPDKAIVV